MLRAGTLSCVQYVLHRHETSINCLLPTGKLEVQVQSPGFVTSKRFYDTSHGVQNIRVVLVPEAEPHKIRICLTSLIQVESIAALHDKQTRQETASAHPYMALLTPERGALVHGEDRIGNLGRDSLGLTPCPLISHPPCRSP